MKNKIFIACDTTDIKKIKRIIKETRSSKIKVGYKFGLELLNSKNGRKFISSLKNKITFGDYKFADIPNTCSSAVKAIKDLRLNYCTIHISSGLEALKAVKKVSGKTKLIGVTILTSLDNKSLKEIGYEKEVKKLVLHQARLASRAKLDAIVCSPHEIKIVKKVFKKEIITPGIRFNNEWDKNQARGIGIVMQNWKTEDKNTGKERYLLSDNVIGHGSATSSVLRIDLDNNILITQTRRRGKANFGKHFKNVYELIDETLVDKK